MAAVCQPSGETRFAMLSLQSVGDPIRSPSPSSLTFVPSTLLGSLHRLVDWQTSANFAERRPIERLPTCYDLFGGSPAADSQRR